MKKILLFDIDGTLLLTGGAGKVAFERAFEELFGIKEAWGDTSPAGKTDPLIIKEIVARLLHRSLTKDEFQALCERYLTYFRTEIERQEKFHLMPGVVPLLKVLSKQENLSLGLATGNFEETALLKLKRGGIHQFFSFGGFGSDSSDRVELTRKAIERGHQHVGHVPPSDHIFVIGDTKHDIRAGKQLNVQTIAVCTGSASCDELAIHKPDYLLNDLTHIEKFLSIID